MALITEHQMSQTKLADRESEGIQYYAHIMMLIHFVNDFI
jgi:hypothetical protein